MSVTLTVRTDLAYAKPTPPWYTPGLSPAGLAVTEICAGDDAEVEPVRRVTVSHPLPSITVGDVWNPMELAELLNS